MELSFTDDDLKRLKEDWFGLTDSGSMLTNVGKLKALIARLRAAEVMAEVYAGEWLRSGSVEAWRKAAGK